jgi:hypothetical protein
LPLRTYLALVAGDRRGLPLRTYLALGLLVALSIGPYSYVHWCVLDYLGRPPSWQSQLERVTLANPAMGQARREREAIAQSLRLFKDEVLDRFDASDQKYETLASQLGELKGQLSVVRRMRSVEAQVAATAKTTKEAAAAAKTSAATTEAVAQALGVTPETPVVVPPAPSRRWWPPWRLLCVHCP